MPVILLALGLLIVVALLVAWSRPASTAPITDQHGRPLPDSIAVLEQVMLGGVRQSLLIRGRDTRNPVLLFLHGGPGTSELAMLRAHNIPALERQFTVVVWDQRGACKSFDARRPVEGMTIEQLVSDTYELAVLLCERFHQDRIYLAGHSWGSALGVLTVARHPQRFRAFVGIGQVVNMLEGERISWAWTMARAEEAGDSRAVRKLKGIGQPPYSGNLRASVILQRSILARYGGEVHGNPRGGMFIVLGSLLKASEYSWRDRINFFRGVFASMDLLWPQILTIDLPAQVPELAVPVYFLAGRHDYESPSVLAERYHQVLKAPAKTLVWFEKSAHFINTEEADAFNRFFTERLLPETSGRMPG